MRKTLYRQLILVAFIICGIVFLSLGLLLPRLMLPIYEKNIYQYLSRPLDFMNGEFTKSLDDVAYIYISEGNKVVVSDNLDKIIDLELKQILEEIGEGCFKFNHVGKLYYYCSEVSDHVTKIALTGSGYISNIRKDILNILLPTLFITLLISVGLVILWSRSLVIKIGKINKKIDNLDNFNYVDDYNDNTLDELSELSHAIDNIKITLKQQDEYKNQMYQNISHDFKTPLTVIKSYLEASEDGIFNNDEVNKVIKEQVIKLENKVHSLLYLNKLNYIKELDSLKREIVDVKEVVNNCITKFKVQRQDVTFNVNTYGKTNFIGTYDMWEAIIDNLLNNFIRYAKSEIKITIKNNKIILFNDGPKIDEDILKSVFSPYTKGIKGQFGLGLSIVKKTLSLLGYEINVLNEKQGVSFIIK